MASTPHAFVNLIAAEGWALRFHHHALPSLGRRFATCWMSFTCCAVAGVESQISLVRRYNQ